MKLYAECIACQVQVRLRDIEKIFNNEDMRIEVMKKVIEHLNKILSKCSSRYDFSCMPTIISTNLFRLIKNITGIDDPYREEKMLVNNEALKIYEELKKVVFQLNDLRDRLLLTFKTSLVGNLIDFGVAGHTTPKLDLDNVVKLINAIDVYGDITEGINLLLKSKNIALILDNAGEAVFDRILADVLRFEGKYVVAIVKGVPFQNDITYSEINYAGLDQSFDEIISTGTDASSIFIEEINSKLLTRLKMFDVILAKGMANYEYITEVESFLGIPIIYVLIAKCRPVAKDLGVPLGKAVIKVRSYFKH